MRRYHSLNSAKLLNIAAIGVLSSVALAGAPTISFHPAGSALKVKLDGKIDSKTAHVGDTFTATVDMGKSPDYFGLPKGTKVEGHVVEATAHEGKTPGSLALAVDDAILPDGSKVEISASMMKMDRANFTNDHGRYMAKNMARSGSTNYVATGALVGVGLAAITGSDLLAGGLVGALIGFLIANSNNMSAHDVTLRPGAGLAVRFDQQAQFVIAN